MTTKSHGKRCRQKVLLVLLNPNLSMTIWKCSNNPLSTHKLLIKTSSEGTSLVQFRLSNTGLIWILMGCSKKIITNVTTYMSRRNSIVLTESLSTRQIYSKELNRDPRVAFRCIKHKITQLLSQIKEPRKKNVACLRAATNGLSLRAASPKSKSARLAALKSSLITTHTKTIKTFKPWATSTRPNNANPITRLKW